MSPRSPILVCFAVPEEARPFRRQARSLAGIEILVTGMGPHNARGALEPRLENSPPSLVLTCGFAGGLDPALAPETVVFSAGGPDWLTASLQAHGARRVRFHCADRVAVTAGEKSALRLATGADAVEMESGVITEICRARGLPCATVRVISDTADEDLPLDFNTVLTAAQRLHPLKLLGAIARQPGRVRGLLQLQRQTAAAAQRLAETLGASLRHAP